MSKQRLSMMLLLAIAVLLHGCGGSKQVAVQSMNTETAKNGLRESKAERLNDLLLKSAMNHPVDNTLDYLVGPDDLLEIEVFQVEELKKSVRVSSQGYIGLPLVGQMKVKGLTTQQIEQELAKRLDKYLEEPLISVHVREFKGQKIAVIGAVMSPQLYPVTGQKYLLDMLTIAGGLARDAGTICYILRPANQEQPGMSMTETLVIDLRELLEKGNLALNIPVFSGDVVNVPKGGVFFVDGAVARPGVYQLTGRTTLVQAVIMAGGTRFEAKKSEIKVFRKKNDGTQELMVGEYDAMQNGQGEDIPLEENDIVIVPSDTFKSFLVGLGSIFSGTISSGGAASVGFHY